MTDRLSVREIMDSCTNMIGAKDGNSKSTAKKDLNRINEEKLRTDDAMDRLKELHTEYCDQLAKTEKPIHISEQMSDEVRKFLTNL